MEQERIFIAADAAEQETLEAGRPVVTARIKEINIKCEIPEKALLNPSEI